jgi:hypothetical protein
MTVLQAPTVLDTALESGTALALSALAPTGWHPYSHVATAAGWYSYPPEASSPLHRELILISDGYLGHHIPHEEFMAGNELHLPWDHNMIVHGEFMLWDHGSYLDPANTLHGELRHWDHTTLLHGKIRLLELKHWNHTVPHGKLMHWYYHITLHGEIRLLDPTTHNSGHFLSTSNVDSLEPHIHHGEPLSVNEVDQFATHVFDWSPSFFDGEIQPIGEVEIIFDPGSYHHDPAGVAPAVIHDTPVLNTTVLIEKELALASVLDPDAKDGDHSPPPQDHMDQLPPAEPPPEDPPPTADTPPSSIGGSNTFLVDVKLDCIKHCSTTTGIVEMVMWTIMEFTKPWLPVNNTSQYLLQLLIEILLYGETLLLMLINQDKDQEVLCIQIQHHKWENGETILEQLYHDILAANDTPGYDIQTSPALDGPVPLIEMVVVDGYSPSECSHSTRCLLVTVVTPDDSWGAEPASAHACLKQNYIA